MDKEYICLSCGKIYAEGEAYECSNCHLQICRNCGGEISTIPEYDEAMRINARES